jgi:hypothetical protein
MSSSNECAANIATNQQLTFENIKTKGCTVNFRDISQEASISQNFSCSQDSSQEAALSAKFKTELDNLTKAETKGLLPSSSQAETINNVKNSVTNNINVSSVAKCIASIISEQKATFGKIDVDCTGADDKSLNFQNINQRLTITQVAKCIQKNAQAAQAVTDFQNAIKNVTEAKSEGLQLPNMASFTSLTSLGTSALPFLISLICFIIMSVSFASSSLFFIMKESPPPGYPGN